MRELAFTAVPRAHTDPVWIGLVICFVLLAGCSGAKAAPAGPQRSCIPGATQNCFGPGACNGGQTCLPDGSGFGPCDCGGGVAAVDATAPSADSGGSYRRTGLPAVSDASTDSSAVVTLPPFTGEAAHLPLPVAYSALPLPSIQIVTVTFAGDVMAANLEAFGATVASSAWWETIRADYCSTSGGPCVGDGPTGTSVQISAAPATSYTDSAQGGPSSLQAWILAQVRAGALPPPDPKSVSNTLYLLYFPKTTSITLDGATSCIEGGFDGYHNTVLDGTSVIPYAVVVECDPVPRASGATAISRLQNATIAASHEIAESATDPIFTTDYETYAAQPDYRAWVDVMGGLEVGDLCIDPLYLNRDEATDGTFTVQRIWANTRARSGVEPCLPAPQSEVYFNASPSQSLLVLDVGQSKTFEVDAFSSAAMPDWSLTVEDWTFPMTGGPYLNFSIAGAKATSTGPVIQANNGSKVQVTVTLLQDPGSLFTQEADGAVVSASWAQGRLRAVQLWPFAVMSPADAADAGIDAAALSREGFAPHRRIPRVHRRFRPLSWPGPG